MYCKYCDLDLDIDSFYVSRPRKCKACVRCNVRKNRNSNDDYSKPLDVRFLCTFHHSEWHKKHGEAKNGN